MQVIFTAFIPVREICSELSAVESTKINIVVSNAISGLQEVLCVDICTTRLETSMCISAQLKKEKQPQSLVQCGLIFPVRLKFIHSIGSFF